jgi:hypothetical protein
MDHKDWKTLSDVAEAQGTDIPGGITVAKKRTCGKCGGKGHNARTCKNDDDEPLIKRPVDDDEPLIKRPVDDGKAKVIDAPSRVIKQKVKRPAPVLSQQEKARRREELGVITQAWRTVYYSRIERWLKDKHQIDARRVTGVEDLKKGQQIVRVETEDTSWGGSEPTKHYRAKVTKFDEKADKVEFKYQRDAGSYAASTDTILNMKVPGRSDYYLVYNGKTDQKQTEEAG